MELKLEDFLYDLPKDRIAKQPLADRSGSKLLFYNKGALSDHHFSDLPELISHESLLVFNNTRVIPARIFFQKETGAHIEVFLLEPVTPASHEEAMSTSERCTWKCMIGNAKKWKAGTWLYNHTVGISAQRTAENEVSFEWESAASFSEKLAEIGQVPLPPYIDRAVQTADETRYQTVYNKVEGAVAAPTAGLHFTDSILHRLDALGIAKDYLTLHVSAGTFQPIKSDNVMDHTMHQETIWITRTNIENLLASKNTLAVGTTAMRTLESTYWYGVKLLAGETVFKISQHDPYSYAPVAVEASLEAVLQHLKTLGQEKLSGQTGIYIYPGYDFKLCQGLVTNFHLPGSTLMLLVSALIGEDWRQVYDHALGHDYRFLSYGDGSLLIP